MKKKITDGSDFFAFSSEKNKKNHIHFSGT